MQQKILFTEEECKNIINLIKINPQKWESNDRLYESLLIEYDEKISWLFDKLKSFFEEATGIEMINLRKDIHYHVFKKNSYFGIHTDNFIDRIYSVGVLLNDNFVGGDFVLYEKDIIKLNKKIGNTYIFDVSVKHEIEKIIDGERYSIIWFVKNDNIKIKKWQKKIF